MKLAQKLLSVFNKAITIDEVFKSKLRTKSRILSRNTFNPVTIILMIFLLSPILAVYGVFAYLGNNRSNRSLSEAGILGFSILLFAGLVALVVYLYKNRNLVK